jgi:amino acid adenylation domain-containing protein
MLRRLPLFQDVASAFHSVAKGHQAACALVQGSLEISYGDLDRLSDVLAARLIEGGVTSGALVGVVASQDPHTIISLLAVLKAGAGYVPMPLYYPEARLRLMAQDAKLATILGSAPVLDEMAIQQVAFDWQACTETANPLLPVLNGGSVAYVMYTSGSTGTPKGVVVPHRAILRLVQGQDFMGLGPDERILQNSPIAFDAATLEIWGALLNGGTLVLPEDTSGSLRALGEVIRDQSITSMWLTAGLFHAMADARPSDFSPLRQLLTGGDVVSPASVAKVMAACPNLTVINGYGPTENTTFTCCHTISRAEADLGLLLPIGKPISGTDVFVLAADLQPVAVGEPGELFAAGDGLALGYLGRPDLTAEKFIAAPWDADVMLYRTGDLVRQDENGVVHYLGRIDTQVKIRGFRIELGEVEAALDAQPGIKQAVVVARSGADHADRMLVAYCVADRVDDAALRASLATRLPDYAVPSRFVALPSLPLNSNGKVDRRALEALALPKAAKAKVTSSRTGPKPHDIEDMITAELATALGADESELDRTANFFDLGASSLHVARVHDGLQTALDRTFPISDFFLHSTIAAMAAYLGKPAKSSGPVVLAPDVDRAGTGLIAIIGLAGKFPGTRTAEEFWDGLVQGREMISQFSADELDVDLSKGSGEGGFVNARGVMPDADMFDAKHFNIPPREAERMDPQHRILLEVAQTALESAGHDPAQFAGKIGIFAGSSQNSYLLNNLLSAPGASRTYAASYPLDDFATLFGNDKDFVATRIAYKLNLRGPAATVLCACSTSLVAVAQGCESLATGTSDMVLAGGVSVTFPSKRNYKYMPDGMASADGHCRTFDAEATGTVFGDGAGLVVLRRLEDALADGDEIIAVIRGYSINNDGSEKAGYAAPSIKAQAAVIAAAHKAAGVSARDIGYIEAHGTATPLGDPIEFAALHQAFSSSTDARGFCALGSAKTNVGHLDIAAGITGLIKAALTLKHGVIPPLLHYKSPNPRMDFAASAFYPVAKLTPWPRGNAPRLAGVSAFGVGGTNIHMVLQEAPVAAVVDTTPAHGPKVYPVSASSPEALSAAVAALGDWAAANPKTDAGAVRATLRRGRHAYSERTVLIADGLGGLADAAKTFAGKSTTAGRRDAVAFLFPGQGAQHVGMARALFDAEPVFREALSLCTTLLKPALGLDLLDIIHAPDHLREEMTARLKDTSLAQPAIFSIGYALAKQWDHWGIRPDVMVGHSIGEFAAATIAGVVDLPDALNLIALRGRLMADLPGGVMVSVRASEAELQPYLGAGLDLAAVNGAKACVLAGSEEAAAAVLPVLEAAGFVTSRLHTSHAFHSHMMEPAVAPFRAAVAKIKLRAPQIPILSTVIGDWLTEQEATDPDYWAGHMRRPVRFYDAMQTLWAEGRHIFLETGPGRTMATLAGQNPDRRRAQPALASLPHAQAENADAHLSMLEAFGGLWANGYPVDWSRLEGDGPEPRRVTGLPTYPFQRKRFWVEPVDVTPVAVVAPAMGLDAPSADAQITAPTPDAPQISAADALRDMLSDLSGVEPADMDGSASFLELGFDSLLLTQATRELSERFGVTVTLRQLIDGFPTIDTLAAHIDAHGNLAGRAPADRTPLAEMTRIEGAEDLAEATPSSAPMTRIIRETEDLTLAQRGHIDALVARYTAKTAKSKALTTQYRSVHADPRTASGFNRLWKEIVYQIVTVKSKGSRLIDVDGNEYIDILNGFGPGFLGHAPEQVVSALHTQLDAGFEVGPQSLLAMEAAALFCEVTGNDRASFVCTGSEAVYAAMRLARTCTGRDRIVMFARDYHGNFDEVLVRGLDGKDGPRSLPMAPGIPRDSVKNVIVLPYGSPQALDYIRKNASSIAAVIVEPVQSRRPEFRPADFIREVRRITENAGSLFIFDEVVTGFRFGPRGAQGYYGVDADLVTYGKVVGGGMPVGVVSGKARFMDTFDGGMWQYGDDSFPEAPVTFFAGTFVRHPLAMAALKAMLTFFKTQPDFFWKTVNAKGDKLAGTVDRWFADNDMPFQMPNCGSLMYLRIGEDQKYGGLLGAGLRDRGVFMLEGFPSYMTAAHDDQDIDHVIEAVKDTALEMRAAGLLVGRDAVAYAGPQVHGAPPRLSLHGGEAVIAAAMRAPLGVLSVPTTEAQREIWAAMIVTPDVAPAYNESVTLKLHGPVDRDGLRAAATTVFRRHDALRSTFSDDGMEMHIQPDMAIPVPLVDLSALTEQDRTTTLAAILAQEVETPFDMAAGPFVRAHLVAFGTTEHHLIITAHHIVCDGWSIDVVMRDIGKVYAAGLEGRAALLPPAQSIVEYARAEAEWSRSPEAAAARDYWLGQFSGPASGPVPVLDLPTDHARTSSRSARGARIDRAIPADLTARLRKLARAQGATFVNLLLAAYKLYVARAAGTSDIVIGLPTAGQAARGMPGVVGHCVNLLPIRTKIDWSTGFDSYLGTVRRAMLDAFDHQTFTYGALIRALRIKRDAGRVMLVPVVFNFDKGIDLSAMSFGQTETDFVTNPRNYEHFDLYLNVTDAADQVLTEWSYSTDLFEPGTVNTHIDQFIALLHALEAYPTKPLARIALEQGKATRGPAPVRAQPDPTEPDTLMSVFARCVAATPDAAALTQGARTLSYADLDAAATALARQLADQGVQPGDLVGVAAKRGLGGIVALLGIVKAGAGYVPLADYFPADRLRLMVAQSGIRHVVGHLPALSGLGLAEIAMQGLADQRASGGFAPAAPLDGHAVAYVMYTSGSTGVPKGVVVPHRGILRLAGPQDYMTLGPDSRILQNSPLAFDAATLEIWGALLNGGTLVIAQDDALSLSALGTTLREGRITTLWLTAGLFHAMADETPEAFAPLTHLLTGGDVVSPARVARVMEACPGLVVINGYGPTENTTFTCCHIISRAEAESGDPLPIGRPLRGTGIHILDAAMQPVPTGETGELYTSGRGLALGYLGRDDLTGAKFVTAPWDPAVLLYNTGDLVRQDAKGLVHFLGRADAQVKIRGFRIELGEVEAALESHPAVKRAVVLATSVGGQHDKVLAAYLLFHAAPVPRSALLDHVKLLLPDHARPVHFVPLTEIPVTANGKVDQRALPSVAVADGVADQTGPLNDTEQALGQIWSETLGIGAINPDSDFFELGGHSLLAVKVFARIKRKFSVDLPISTLFAHPTIRTLARRISDTVDTSAGLPYSGTPEDAPWDTTVVVHSGAGTTTNPLFVVGGVGGNVNNLVELGRALGGHRALIGLQTRGILGHRMHETIEATATDHLNNIRHHQPQGPYLLAGYSGGAFTAFEMARQLLAAGEEVAFLGLLDTSAPKFTFQKSGKWTDRLGYSAKLLRRHGPKPLWINAKSWLQSRLQPDAVVRAGIALRPEKFRHVLLERQWWKISALYNPAPYEGDAWLFLTESDLDGFTVTQMRKLDPLYGWKACVGGALRVSRHASGHLSMLTGDAVRDLAGMIEAEIQYAKTGR